MLETILNNFHLEKILWILQKRIAYIMILGVLGGMAGGAYAYLTNSTLYRAEVSFYVYSDPDYVYDSSVNISNSEFTQAKNLVQSYILILKSNTILQKVLEEPGWITERKLCREESVPVWWKTRQCSMSTLMTVILTGPWSWPMLSAGWLRRRLAGS